MGPRNENTQHTPDPGLLGLALPSAPVTSVPQHTLGATGRIWSMPSSYGIPESPTHCSQFFPTNDSCIKGLLRFLDAYAPELASSWSSSLHPVEDNHAKLVMSYNLSRIEHESPLHIVPERPSQPAPRDIKLPTLDRSHWAWGAHYELGHGKSTPDNLVQDCSWEAKDDLGHIGFYLKRYKELAREYCGSRLEAATWAPQFRGPYFTCMDICVMDLRLPSHFIALVHYGIAVQMIHIASSVESARPVLNRLTEMYCEDFAA